MTLKTEEREVRNPDNTLYPAAYIHTSKKKSEILVPKSLETVRHAMSVMWEAWYCMNFQLVKRLRTTE